MISRESAKRSDKAFYALIGVFGIVVGRVAAEWGVSYTGAAVVAMGVYFLVMLAEWVSLPSAYGEKSE